MKIIFTNAFIQNHENSKYLVYERDVLGVFIYEGEEVSDLYRLEYRLLRLVIVLCERGEKLAYLVACVRVLIVHFECLRKQ